MYALWNLRDINFSSRFVVYVIYRFTVPPSSNEGVELCETQVKGILCYRRYASLFGYNNKNN